MYQILIVDDENTVLTGLSEYTPWDSIGCVVSGVAKDGLEAIDFIQNTPPDIVITDIKMPRLNGIGVAQYVSENCPQIKVVLLTGFAEFEYAQSAIIYGVSDYILKPVSKDILLKTVAKLTVKISAERALAPTSGAQTLYSKKQHTSPLVKKAITYIQNNYSANLSLEMIAAQIPITPSHLSRKFKKDTGETVTEYITRTRIEKAKELLTFTDMLAYEVAEAVGFKDPTYFSLVFKKFTGISPKDF